MFFSSQDCRQRVLMGFECILELYRVIIGSCLIWFIPHSCDSDANPGYGSISDINLFSLKTPTTWGELSEKSFTSSASLMRNGEKQQQPCGWFPEGVHSYGIMLNLITLGSFLALYGIEVYRENALISYLEVTPLLGTDNASVGEIVAKLDPQKRKKLYWIDTVYFGCGGVCMCIFGANSIFSGIILLDNLDNKTVTTFVTDILFMMTKLYRIYYVINTEKNIFYSAYMMNFVQFNDLDPTERAFIENRDLVEDTCGLESEHCVWEEDWVSCKTGEEEKKEEREEEHITIMIDML